jgi:tetratricopeptide (TPR) repeat protein
VHGRAPGNPAYPSELVQTLLYESRQANFPGGFGLNEAKARFERVDELLEQAVSLCTKVVRDYPQVADYQYRLAKTLQNQAVLRNNLRKPHEAKATCEKALPYAERLARAHPDVAEYQNRLAMVRIELANSLAQMGDYKSAAREVRSATAGKALAGLAFFNAAGAYCHCSNSAKDDSKLAETERKELTAEYLDAAMALLLEAEKTDWAKKADALDLLETEDDVAPLRQERKKEFNDLVSRLKARVREDIP